MLRFMGRILLKCPERSPTERLIKVFFSHEEFRKHDSAGAAGNEISSMNSFGVTRNLSASLLKTSVVQEETWL